MRRTTSMSTLITNASRYTINSCSTIRFVMRRYSCHEWTCCCHRSVVETTRISSDTSSSYLEGGEEKTGWLVRTRPFQFTIVPTILIFRTLCCLHSLRSPWRPNSQSRFMKRWKRIVNQHQSKKKHWRWSIFHLRNVHIQKSLCFCLLQCAAL